MRAEDVALLRKIADAANPPGNPNQSAAAEAAAGSTPGDVSRTPITAQLVLDYAARLPTTKTDNAGDDPGNDPGTQNDAAGTGRGEAADTIAAFITDLLVLAVTTGANPLQVLDRAREHAADADIVFPPVLPTL